MCKSFGMNRKGIGQPFLSTLCIAGHGKHKPVPPFELSSLPKRFNRSCLHCYFDRDLGGVILNLLQEPRARTKGYNSQ